MAQKHYNPNTKYGRKKMRQQSLNNIANYTPEEKAEYQKTMMGCYVFIIVFVVFVFILIYYFAGEKAALKWLR
ncbi:MAG: hypothetical protein ACP5N7_04895 [Candidatus Pacearchaeota archaeon]